MINRVKKHKWNILFLVVVSLYLIFTIYHSRKILKQIRKETILLQGDIAVYVLYAMASKTSYLDGDIAEVGVYKGATAKIICEASKHKQIHLFDTFEGLPSLSSYDDLGIFKEGHYTSSFNYVKEYLKEYKNSHIYKGIFPYTAECIKDKTFCFVHLDVDIYESTLECLRFFYPRMSKCGIIISHDYQGSIGVHRAFDEFFVDKPEIVRILLGKEQCMIVKL